MKTHESILRDLLRLIVWYPFRWLILLLPVSTALFLFRRMGDIHYFLALNSREKLRRNLSLLLGGQQDLPAAHGVAEQNRLIRNYLRNHYVDSFFILLFPGMDQSTIAKLVTFSGREHLDQAARENRGVVLVHGHFGPVHLPLVALAKTGYSLKQIGLPSDEGLSWIGKNVAFRLRVQYESRIPAEIIKADTFLRSAFSWLKENNILMITGDGTGTDQRVGRHKIFPFFQQPVYFPLGPASLADKTGAVLLPLFILPGKKNMFEIIIEPPLQSDLEGEAGRIAMTGQFVKRLEHYISQYPGYMHFLDRFQPNRLITSDNCTGDQAEPFEHHSGTS